MSPIEKENQRLCDLLEKHEGVRPCSDFASCPYRCREGLVEFCDFYKIEWRQS